MEDSFAETKHELYELMQRMRHDRITPPIPEGVTPSEARTMMAVFSLDACGEPVRPGRVAEISHTTPSALSQTFKALEEKGLIERHRTSDDYRAVTVSLTDEGRRFAAEGRRLRDDHMEQIMAYLGESDMAHLVRILKRVVEYHDGSGIEGAPAPCSCDAPAAEVAHASAAGADTPDTAAAPCAHPHAGHPGASDHQRVVPAGDAPEGGEAPCA